ncbi:flagellar basal-body rod modification protein FlgD [Dyella jiangningensis]|uniref:flagellar hook assembly protein FlgD n=2 Tax=Gammaproteobacteria TaxID=1236 RepID=UPI000887FE7F|nr:flagellar hook capping FlgD N-terminal domain-containing protein [Dyella sp. AtDHG13]PXV52621.1 flagellar basal-body rod modification protein FlgD [Dyella sp. AtDHG13]SDL53958.1 flagellar basal-body rod modification protein FlgD [Dyella jiangningensis]
MSTIPSTTNTSSSSSSSSTSSVNSALSSTMTQADFLKLMTAQLQAQDPTNPVDNSQFVSQMAQFSQLSATQQLDTDLQSLATNVNTAMQTSQVLSSSNLVNREVLVPGSSATYDGSDAVKGAVNVTSATTVNVQILDGNGNVVRNLPLGAQSAGLAQFSWDGKDDNGNALAAGTYTVKAASGSTSLDTYVAGTVTGVGYGGSSLGTYLQVSGVGGVPLSQVAQIL